MSKLIEKKYKKTTLIDNYKKILTAINPVIPHFSNECLTSLNVENISWPDVNEKILKEKTISIVVQINGKKRGLIDTEIDITEEKLVELIEKNNFFVKYLENKLIKRKIYIKNKLINLIV